MVYSINKGRLLSSASFKDASREELRVIIALLSTEGRVDSSEGLAKLAGVSVPRATAAIALWRAEGVISESSGTPCQEKSVITEEFEERIRPGEIPEITAEEAALSLRDEGLREMIELIADMLGEAALSGQAVKRLTATVTELAITPEYLLTLAAFMKERGNLTVTRITAEAERLVKRGIDNTESLEAYIHDVASATASERELRRLFGIYDRAVTPTMKKYFLKWTEELGFGVEIVGEAYDISSTSTGKLALAHIDKILTGWHEAGCKTLAECRAEAEKKRAADAEKYSERRQNGRSKPKAEAEKPRYGSFDINEAFQKALERSYGKSEK